MIFLKHFSVNKQTLKGVGKVYVQRNSKVGDLVSTINMKMGWASTTPIRLFEVCCCRLFKASVFNVHFSQEIKPGMIEHMKSKMTFTQSEIQDGDIICFQVELPEKEYVNPCCVWLISSSFQPTDPMTSNPKACTRILCITTISCRTAS